MALLSGTTGRLVLYQLLCMTRYCILVADFTLQMWLRWKADCEVDLLAAMHTSYGVHYHCGMGNILIGSKTRGVGVPCILCGAARGDLWRARAGDIKLYLN